jgi:catalase
MHYHRDGHMRFDGNFGAAPNYEPNSFHGPAENPEYRERPRPLTGALDRYDHHLGNDDFTQAGNLFRLLKPDAQKRLIGNIVGSMKSVPKAIQERQIGHFLKADPAYGRGVAEGLGLNVEDLLPREPALASD